MVLKEYGLFLVCTDLIMLHLGKQSQIFYLIMNQSINSVYNLSFRYDQGSIVIKVGREEPAMSMDVNGGKIIWAKHSEIQQANLKALPEGIILN